MSEIDVVSRAVIDVAGDLPGVVSVYLFGSVAADRAHRESDVDLGVLLDYARYPQRRGRFDARLVLVGALAASLRRDADVVILNDAPPQLVRRILSAGRRVYCADPASDRAFLRTTLSRAADLEPFLRRARRAKLERLLK